MYVKLEYEKLFLNTFTQISEELNFALKKAIEYKTQESLKNKALIEITSIEKGSIILELSGFLLGTKLIFKLLRGVIVELDAVIREINKLIQSILELENTIKAKEKLKYLISFLHHIYNLSKLSVKANLRISISVDRDFSYSKTVFIDQRTYNFFNSKLKEGILYSSERKITVVVNKLERLKKTFKIGNQKFIAKATVTLNKLNYEVFIKCEKQLNLLAEAFKNQEKISITIRPFINIQQYAKPNKAELVSID